MDRLAYLQTQTTFFRHIVIINICNFFFFCVTASFLIYLTFISTDIIEQNWLAIFFFRFIFNIFDFVMFQLTNILKMKKMLNAFQI